MSEIESPENQPVSPWLHRLAVLLVCLTWPLIWIGGLVTTYDAGMAVPDWPQTYGFNMFLYPWKTWLLGPFDLLIEHGHRLLASVVGFLTIAAMAVAYAREPRRWVYWLSVLTFVAVLFQGVLGGLRVRLDARTLAMLHGCFGPTFFVLCVILAGVTGKVWLTVGRSKASIRVSRQSFRLAATLASGAFLQIILGAQLRHVQVTASTGGFRHLVWTHIAVAVLVLLLTSWLAWRLTRCGDLTLSKPGMFLVVLVALQIGLGLLTWAANYGWPWMLDDWPLAARHLIEAKGWWESMITTSHVAIGSLILSIASLVTLRTARAIDAASDVV